MNLCTIILNERAKFITPHTFFVLDLCLDILNGVTWFNFEGDGFPSESFDKYLHATSQTKNQMEGRLLLDVVV